MYASRKAPYSRRWLVLPLALLALVVTEPATAADKGAVERIQVRGRSLEGNLAGDSPVRDVAVYLPPSYAADGDRRYPVVYMLHGFTDSVAKWFSPEHWITLPDVLDRSLARDDSREVIVVMPDALTRFYGSFYSNSANTGDWETFVAKELVAYIDSHYRTLPDVASRGLAGHSMGGYGTLRIGMKNPDVFSSIYLLNPCCLSPGNRNREMDGPPPWELVKTDDELAKADFGTKAVIALAAAFAPNPKNPPFYFDLPTKDGEPRPEILAKIAANSPLAQIDQYITSLRQLKAIAFDAGDQERGIAPAVRLLDGVLNDYGIAHDFEIYEGNHTNRVAERIETKTMPFFTRRLKFE